VVLYSGNITFFCLLQENNSYKALIIGLFLFKRGDQMLKSIDEVKGYYDLSR